MFTALNSAIVGVGQIGFLDISIHVVPFVATLLISFAILLPTLLFHKWFFYRRRLSRSVITAQYDPPLGMTPAELGCLFDGAFNKIIVTATIIHLIQRQLIVVNKVSGQPHLFIGTAQEDNLKRYEQLIVDMAKAEKGASLESVLGIAGSNHSSGFAGGSGLFGRKTSSVVFSDLRKAGYVTESHPLQLAMSVFKLTIIFTVAMVWAPLFTSSIDGALLAGTTDAADGAAAVSAALPVTAAALPFLGILSLAVVLIRSRLIGREWIVTRRLKRFWPQVVGYRQYLKLSQTDKLKFHNSKLKTASENDMLPYSVALGFVKDWRSIL